MTSAADGSREPASARPGSSPWRAIGYLLGATAFSIGTPLLSFLPFALLAIYAWSAEYPPGDNRASVIVLGLLLSLAASLVFVWSWIWDGLRRRTERALVKLWHDSLRAGGYR